MVSRKTIRHARGVRVHAAVQRLRRGPRDRGKNLRPRLVVREVLVEELRVEPDRLAEQRRVQVVVPDDVRAGQERVHLHELVEDLHPLAKVLEVELEARIQQGLAALRKETRRVKERPALCGNLLRHSSKA